MRFRDEVGKHYNMGRLEDLDAALVLGAKDAAVLEVFHKLVEVVDLVGLGASEVYDHNGLIVISEGEVGQLPMGDNGGRLEGEKVIGHEGLAGVSGGVHVPKDLTGVRFLLYNGEKGGLPGPEDRRLHGLAEILASCGTSTVGIQLTEKGHTASNYLGMLRLHQFGQIDFWLCLLALV